MAAAPDKVEKKKKTSNIIGKKASRLAKKAYPAERK